MFPPASNSIRAAFDAVFLHFSTAIGWLKIFSFFPVFMRFSSKKNWQKSAKIVFHPPEKPLSGPKIPPAIQFRAGNLSRNRRFAMMFFGLSEAISRLFLRFSGRFRRFRSVAAWAESRIAEKRKPARAGLAHAGFTENGLIPRENGRVLPFFPVEKRGVYRLFRARGRRVDG